MTPHRMTKVTLLILLTAAAVAIGFVLGRDDSDSTGYEAGTTMPSLRILGMIPPFMLTDQSGNAFGLDDLRGQAWVASFIFTRCPAACPMVMSNKVRLRDALRDDATLDAVSLVSFTVDPDHDTAEVLQRYALGMGAAPDRWRFLTGTRDQIWQLSRDGFKLAVADTPDEGQGPITHSSKLVLVDGGGRVRGYYDGLDKGSVKSIVRDLARLRDEPDPGAEVTQTVPGATAILIAASSTDTIDPRSASEPRAVAIPPELDETAWLEGRRLDQLDTAGDLKKAFHDFTFSDRLEESGIQFRHRFVDDAGKTYRPVHYDHGNGVRLQTWTVTAGKTSISRTRSAATSCGGISAAGVSRTSRRRRALSSRARLALPLRSPTSTMTEMTTSTSPTFGRETFSSRTMVPGASPTFPGNRDSIDVTPIKGFTRSECIPFKGDEIRHTVAWKQGSKLDSLKGKTIKLKFHLRHAKLYSFQFGN